MTTEMVESNPHLILSAIDFNLSAFENEAADFDIYLAKDRLEYHIRLPSKNLKNKAWNKIFLAVRDWLNELQKENRQ